MSVGRVATCVPRLEGFLELKHSMQLIEAAKKGLDTAKERGRETERESERFLYKALFYAYVPVFIYVCVYTHLMAHWRVARQTPNVLHLYRGSC